MLTGAALALTLAFLLENPVEAAALGAGSSGGEDDGLEGGPNQRQARARRGGPAEDPTGEDGGAVRSPAAPPQAVGGGVSGTFTVGAASRRFGEKVIVTVVGEDWPAALMAR